MIFREATIDDLPAVVAMLADDPLGQHREEFAEPLPESYVLAFESIDADPHQELIVLEQEASVIGTMQLSYLQYLNYRGGVRLQIESVRIHREFRGQNLGQAMIRWAIDRGRDRGAHIVQLTSDKQRPAAISFYERLGFEATHEGMKLHLSNHKQGS